MAETKPDSVFINKKIVDSLDVLFLFVFCTYLLGFKRGYRLLLFLDRTHVLQKQNKTSFGMISKDDKEGLFFIPFSIIDNETDNNLTWFVASLE